MSMYQEYVDPAEVERQVVEYLRQHPDFFEQHRDLLGELRIPHTVAGAVSLIERQVTVLRDQNRHLKRQLQELVQIGRDNDRVNERMHELALALLSATDLVEALEILRHKLHDDFAADAVAVWLFAAGLPAPLPPGARHIARDDLALTAFAADLRQGVASCGHYAAEQLEPLFGGMAEAIGSLALIPLGDHGLLAIGSHDEERFSPGVGTVYLNRMGALVTGVLRRWL